jgi:hypothetical protein
VRSLPQQLTPCSHADLRLPPGLEQAGDGAAVYAQLLAAITRPEGYVPETPRMRAARANHAAVTKAYTYIALSAAVGVMAVLVYRWGRTRSA